MRLWVGLLGGAAAWTLQLLLSYLVVALACGPETPLAGALDALGGPTLALTLISMVAALGAAGSSVAAVAEHRASRADPVRGERRGGLALVGLTLDLLFMLVIVTGASAPFLLPTCAP